MSIYADSFCRSPGVTTYIDQHFTLQGEAILKDGKHINGARRADGRYLIRIGTVDGKAVFWLRSRLKWYLATREIPDELDHVDCDRSNDEMVNLRPATRQQNLFNRRTRKRPSGLPRYIYFDKKSGRYFSQMRVDGKQKRFGSSKNAKDIPRLQEMALAVARSKRGAFYRERAKRPAKCLGRRRKR